MGLFLKSKKGMMMSQWTFLLAIPLDNINQLRVLLLLQFCHSHLNLENLHNLLYHDHLLVHHIDDN
jgi:hypothetical protein